MKDSYGNSMANMFRAFKNMQISGGQLHVTTIHGLKLNLDQGAWPDLVDDMLWQLGAAQADASGDVFASVDDVMSAIESMDICTDGRQFGISRNYVAGRLADAYGRQQVQARHGRQQQQPSLMRPSQHAANVLEDHVGLSYSKAVLLSLEGPMS